jgi:ribosomal subunit interface protein
MNAMSLRISGKHMELGDSFRSQISSRIGDAIDKYFDGGFSGHVVVEKSGSRYAADCNLHLDSGVNLQAEGEAQDPQVAFEKALERIEKRLRRYKRRLKDRNVEPIQVDDIAYRVMESISDEDIEIASDYAPVIVAESVVALKTLSVANAVMELDMKDSPVFVFRNGANGHVNIVYRRNDGNIGWIDSSAAAANN